MAVYALDTSAVSAALREEPGADVVRRVLSEAENSPETVVLMPFMALMEIEYTSLRDETQRRVDRWLAWVSNWPVQVMESTYEWRRTAAIVKSRYRLSLADAWVAALALINDATLLHKEPEFDAVGDLQHLRLPYDRDIRAST